MKLLFAFVLSLTVCSQAEPIVSGDFTIDAEALDQQRGRLEACYREANREDNYWRARLDDQKIAVEAHHQWIGPLQSDIELEQSWQTQLQQSRAQLTLSLSSPKGWSSGLSSRWEQTEGQISAPLLRSWVATPEWQNWSARGEWNTENDSYSYLASICKRLDRGQLQLETTITRGDSLQQRWLASYQWKLNQSISFSTSGSRTFDQINGKIQDQVEARVKVQF